MSSLIISNECQNIENSVRTLLKVLHTDNKEVHKETSQIIHSIGIIVAENDKVKTVYPEEWAKKNKEVNDLRAANAALKAHVTKK